MTYLFYDIEATGLNNCFDQILQFAAIRTDDELNELERYEYHLTLNPDVIPSPRAYLTHLIPIHQQRPLLGEHTVTQQIHQLFNTPNTISVGYNNLGFDDEFLRFSFYRNLLSPYTHQYANGCSRMDIFPLTVMYRLFKSDIIEWPMDNGMPRLKLDLINALNQLAEGQAHDAMVDVLATLALAKKFFHATDMWRYLCGFFHKGTDQQRVQDLPLHQADNRSLGRHGLMFSASLGAREYYHAPVLSLGEHQHYKNQTLWLRLDTETLSQTTPDAPEQSTWVIRKKWGEPGFLLPPKARFLQHLNSSRQTLAEENLAWLAEHPAIFEQIKTHYQTAVYPEWPHIDSYANLYQGGFLSQADAAWCHRFQQQPVATLGEYLETTLNANLRELALRLVGKNYPSALSSDQQAEFQHYLDTIYQGNMATVDYKGRPRLTRQEALTEIDAITTCEPLSDQEKSIIAELTQWLSNLSSYTQSV